MSLPDFIGIIGIAFVLTCYFLVQAEKMNANSIKYQLLNMAGCILILVSIFYSFNLPSAIIQVVWFFISLYGLMRNLSKSKLSKSD